MKKTKLRRMKLDEMSNVMDVIEEKFQEMYVGGYIPVSCSNPDLQALFNQLVNNCSGSLDLMQFVGERFYRRREANFDVTIGDQTFHINHIDAYVGSNKDNNIIDTFASGGIKDDEYVQKSTFNFNAVREGVARTATSLFFTTSIADSRVLQNLIGSRGCTGATNSDNSGHS